MPKVIPYKQIDITNLTFDKPKKLQTNYRSNIRYKTEQELQPLYIQTPKLYCDCTVQKHEQGYHYVDLTVDLTKNKDFHNFLLSVDEACVNQIVEQSEHWFGKAIKQTAAENSYRSPLKANRSGINLRARFMYDEYHELSTQIYDRYLNSLELEEIEEHAKVIVILTISGLWISRYSTEVRWSVVQMKVFDEESESLDEYLIKDDSENEEEYFDGNEIVYSDSESENETE